MSEQSEEECVIIGKTKLTTDEDELLDDSTVTDIRGRPNPVLMRLGKKNKLCRPKILFDQIESPPTPELYSSQPFSHRIEGRVQPSAERPH